MKKFITGILAFSLTGALFTGCGQTDYSGESSASTIVEGETSERETVNETNQESVASTDVSEITIAETSEISEKKVIFQPITKVFCVLSMMPPTAMTMKL